MEKEKVIHSEGEWHVNKFNGKRIYIHSDGDKYEGEWNIKKIHECILV